MKYDVVIVGGGSAGCTLATRLSEDPNTSVLLLEAGPDYPDFDLIPDEVKFGYDNSASEPGSPFNWSYRGTLSARQEGPRDIARGKLIGGSGSVNGQIFLRGMPEDYDGWAEQGNDEWSYLNVLPFFRNLETDQDIHDDFHGSEGPIPVRRVARDQWLPLNEAFYQAALAAGFPHDPDMNNPDATGTGPVPMNNPDNIRTSLRYSIPQSQPAPVEPYGAGRRAGPENCLRRRTGGGRGGEERRRTLYRGGRRNRSLRRRHRLPSVAHGLRRRPGRAPPGPRYRRGQRRAGSGPEPKRPSLGDPGH